MGAAGEAGEIANKVAKAMRDDDGVITAERSKAISFEIGDVLWNLAALASDLGMSLGQIAVDNYDKLLDREKRGTVKGDGDYR